MNMKLKVGSRMPSLDGAEEWLNEEVEVDAYQGWIIMVQFWAMSCSASRLNMPHVIEMLNHYRASRVALVSVHLPRMDADKDIKAVKRAMTDLSLEGPCAVDNHRIIGERFQPDGLWPYYFVFDRSLKLRNRAAAGFGLRMIDCAIQRLLESEVTDTPDPVLSSHDELNDRQPLGQRSATELFFKAGRAIANWGAAGFKTVDPEVLASRLDSCRKCEYLVAAPDRLIYKLHRRMSRTNGQICSQCGCVVASKARLPTERCPVADPANPGFNRWGQPMDSSAQNREA